MYGRGADGRFSLFPDKQPLKWWHPSNGQELAVFACECHAEQVSLQKATPWMCSRCGGPSIQLCSKCTTRDKEHRPENGSTRCRHCKNILNANEDITVDDGAGIWRYKGVPFYSKGKTTGEENDDFVMAGYVNLRIGELEAEVKELRGIVDDLLECIRMGK